jgi:ERF superfamily
MADAPEAIGNVWTALHNVQRDAPKLKLGKDSSGNHSKYLSLNKLMDGVMPLLNANNLAWVTLPSENEDGKPTLRYKLIHVTTISGYPATSTIEGEMPLTMEKQTSQAHGSAITYARRYVLVSVLGLVPDEDDDGQAASEPAKAKPAANGNATLLTIAQRNNLAERVKTSGGDLALLMASVGAETLDQLTVGHAKKIVALLGEDA